MDIGFIPDSDIDSDIYSEETVIEPRSDSEPEPELEEAEELDPEPEPEPELEEAKKAQDWFKKEDILKPVITKYRHVLNESYRYSKTKLDMESIPQSYKLSGRRFKRWISIFTPWVTQVGIPTEDDDANPYFLKVVSCVALSKEGIVAFNNVLDEDARLIRNMPRLKELKELNFLETIKDEDYNEIPYKDDGLVFSIRVLDTHYYDPRENFPLFMEARSDVDLSFAICASTALQMLNCKTKYDRPEDVRP